MRYNSEKSNKNAFFGIVMQMADDLIQRPVYLEQALMFRDTDLVKVITGVRRCGKSSLLQLIKDHIERESVPGRAFVSLNLEDREVGVRTDEDLYECCKAQMGEGTTYIFIDEIQRIAGWHDVINSLRVGFDCDIYLTGSNAFLLSGELATYLSGRYVEIKMLPLSFREYADFCGLRPNAGNSLMLRDGGEPILTDDLLARFLQFGGMPAIASLSTTQLQHAAYLSSLYETVLVRDILDRQRNVIERAIGNSDLLRLICEFLADNIGNTLSANGMAGALSQTMKVTDKTVSAYVRALNDAYAFYPVRRYDLHGKAVLKTLPKQYIVDTGLRSFLLGYRPSDMGRVFENAVFLQLLHEGWSVKVGKLYQKEVDFVCIRNGEVQYMQVADNMFGEDTLERELAPLRSIPDNHAKCVVVRQGNYPQNIEGIRIIRAADFFLR